MDIGVQLEPEWRMPQWKILALFEQQGNTAQQKGHNHQKGIKLVIIPPLETIPNTINNHPLWQGCPWIDLQITWIWIAMTQACTDHPWAGDPFPQVTHDFTGTHMKMYDNKLFKKGGNGTGGIQI